MSTTNTYDTTIEELVKRKGSSRIKTSIIIHKDLEDCKI